MFTAVLHLPIDLTLIEAEGSPLQRLLEGQVTLDMALKRPDLASMGHLSPTLAGLSGTVEGTLRVQGAYEQLGIEMDLSLKEVGIRGILERVSAPCILQPSINLWCP